MVLAASLQLALVDTVALHVGTGREQVVMAVLSSHTASLFTSLEWREVLILVVCCLGEACWVACVCWDVTVRVSVELVTWLTVFGVYVQRLL